MRGEKENWKVKRKATQGHQRQQQAADERPHASMKKGRDLRRKRKPKAATGTGTEQSIKAPVRAELLRNECR